MGLLEDLIAQSQQDFPEEFFGRDDRSFSALNPNIQSAAAAAVTQRAALIRATVTEPSQARGELIKSTSLDIVNLFKLGQSTVDRFNETQRNAAAINEQILIRESQRAADQGAQSKINQIFAENQLALGEATRTATKATEGQDNPLTQFGAGIFDFFKGSSNTLLIGGLVIAGLFLAPKIIGGFLRINK